MGFILISENDNDTEYKHFRKDIKTMFNVSGTNNHHTIHTYTSISLAHKDDGVIVISDDEAAIAFKDNDMDDSTYEDHDPAPIQNIAKVHQTSMPTS